MLTNFTDYVTRITAEWLNRIDVLHQTIFDAATTKAQARAALDVDSATDLASNINGKGASLVGIEDAGGYFAATTVEGALAEHIADTSDAHDASAISILDTAGNFTATDVEGALSEVYSDLASTSDTALGDALVGFKQAGTGATAGTLHGELAKTIRASHYSTIQEALNAAETAGIGEVIFDREETVSTPVLIPDNMTIRWVKNKRLIAAVGFPVNRCVLEPKNSPAVNIALYDPYIDGDNQGTKTQGIGFLRVNGFSIINPRVVNCTGYGIWFVDATGGTTYAKKGLCIGGYVDNCLVGIEPSNSRQIAIIGNHVRCVPGRTTNGIHTLDGSRDIKVAYNTVEDTAAGYSGTGIDVMSATDVDLIGNTARLELTSSSGIALQINYGTAAGASKRIRVIGGEYYSAGYKCVYVDTSSSPGAFEEISFDNVRLDGYGSAVECNTPTYGITDLRINNCTINARGPTTGDIATYGVYYPYTLVHPHITGCNISVTGQSGFEIPIVKYRAQYIRHNILSPDPGPIDSLVYRSTAQSIPGVTYTAISFDAQTRNNIEAYDGGAPTRLTVPNNITKIRLFGQAEFAGNATGARGVQIRKNGTTGVAYQQTGNAGAAISSIIPVRTTVLAVTPGDYFELLVYQASGGALNANATNTWFAMEPA